MTEQRLSGTTAFITGAASGIGRAVCQRFAGSGARVAAADMNGDGAQATAAGLLGGGHLALELDVTDREAAARVADEVYGVFQRVDALINCAGTIHAAPFLDEPLEAWQRVFRVNVEGPFNLTQLFGPRMCEQSVNALGCRAKIINLSSEAAEIGRPFVASYGASKAALNHLSKSTAVVLGADNVATTVVYPGTVAEGMWSNHLNQLAEAEGRSVEELNREREASIPGVFQRAEEVAELVHYVAATHGLELNGKLLFCAPHVTEIS